MKIRHRHRTVFGDRDPALQPPNRSPNHNVSNAPQRRETTASHLEAYRHALARITPAVGASFASVFVRDRADPRLLRLACAHNWPQAAARWLGDLRIMEGRGPTGRAVGRNRSVEVPDVFAEPSLTEWWDPARELGFASIIALPLAREGKAFGALSFYFAESRVFAEDDRAILTRAASDLQADELSGGRYGPETVSR